jgi:hypothetical protein
MKYHIRTSETLYIYIKKKKNEIFASYGIKKKIKYPVFFSDYYYVFGGPDLWPENRALLNEYNTRTVRETINRS